LFKAILSRRNWCQEKGKKESPLTSSSACARKISTEWRKKNSETPCSGFGRNYLESSAALSAELEKTQNLITPVKSKSTILIFSAALCALQAITFQLGTLEKTELSE